MSFNIPVDNYVHIISRVVIRCVQCLLFIGLATKTLVPRDFKNYKFYKTISTVGLIISTVTVYLFGSRYFSYSYINFIFIFLCMIFSSIFFRNIMIQNQIVIFIYFIAFSAVSYIIYNSYNIVGATYDLSGILNNIIPATGSIFLAYMISLFLLPRLICFNNNKFNTDIILFILSFVGFLCLSFRAVNNNLLISSFVCLVLSLVLLGFRSKKIRTTKKLIEN